MISKLPPSRPMYEPDNYSYAGGYYNWRDRSRRDIRASLSAAFGNDGHLLLTMDNQTMIRTLKIALKIHFNSPDLVAIQREGEEGRFRKLVEAAWVATPKVSARVLYVPNIAGEQVIFSLGGPIQHSAHVESYDLGLSDLRTRTRYRSALVVTLGEREQKIGSLVLAWRQNREIMVRYPDGRVERRREAHKELDPFVHLGFLAQIGTDLTRVFVKNPLFLANYLL